MSIKGAGAVASILLSVVFMSGCKPAGEGPSEGPSNAPAQPVNANTEEDT